MSETKIINKIIKEHKDEKSPLISILQDIQEKFGFLSKDDLIYLSKQLNIPLSVVYGVVTFYSQFRLNPRGKHLIKVCLGTACYVGGNKRIFDFLKNKLGVEDGGTTKDLKFTLESVRCLGSCALAPVVMINNTVYSDMTTEKIEKLLNKLK